ncbi:MAG: hypothetical protein PF692_04910 [Kiritimatiellae bacterium]|nr:hypothetical protein [Kiritimatiellia bacterium]
MIILFFVSSSLFIFSEEDEKSSAVESKESGEGRVSYGGERKSYRHIPTYQSDMGSPAELRVRESKVIRPSYSEKAREKESIRNFYMAVPKDKTAKSDYSSFKEKTSYDPSILRERREQKKVSEEKKYTLVADPTKLSVGRKLESTTLTGSTTEYKGYNRKEYNYDFLYTEDVKVDRVGESTGLSLD